PLSLSSTASSMASANGLAAAASPSVHVAQNPGIGDSGEVESRAVAPTAEALPKINSSVGALAAAPPPQICMPDEEEGMADECDSTSLSAICARMIQSCTYTIEVKVCGSETKINGDSTFSWQIIEGTRTSMKDLLACIAGTSSFALCSKDNIILEYVDSISGKHLSVSNDEECMKMFDCFEKNRSGHLIIKYSERSDNVDVPCTPSNQTPSIALPSQPSNVMDEASVCLTNTYLNNPHEEYEHVGVDEEDQYSIGSVGSDSDDEVGEKDIPNIDYVEDSSDDEEWVTEDARPDAILEIAYDKENPPMHVGAKYPNIEELRLAISTYAVKKEFEFKVEKSEPTRFRAYCRQANKTGCKWRIHVGRLDDRETMEVKVHVQEHTCSSTKKKKKQKNASNAWVCEKVMD
uniref:Transposase MuDR plant domain-containing protein n=2 Tax=Aegilops tauschii subsp. strangulata TaxID=200361 RepID=A0A453H847_AEGTS